MCRILLNHRESNRKISAIAAAVCSLVLVSASVSANSQFSAKAIAVIKSCSDADISGFATLKERSSKEGVKEVEVYMQVNGLGDSHRAVHIHETASCEPCGSAGGHFDPGNFGMTNPDANHPYHAGDLINIKSQNNIGTMSTITSRVTVSDGPLGVIDADGSAFIVHDNPDSYCPEGEVKGCAGGSRAACGIILPVATADNFELHVSKHSWRRSPVELANTELRRDAYIFLSPIESAEAVAKVDFFLDGNYVKTEIYPPYDMKGTRNDGSAASLSTWNLHQGNHTAAAIVYLESGARTFVSSQFSVGNRSRH